MDCGTLHDMPLNKRRFICACGVDMDRDTHAASNIIRQALAELTPVELEALAVLRGSETTNYEAGTDNL